MQIFNEIYATCHHYIGTWASFQQIIQKKSTWSQTMCDNCDHFKQTVQIYSNFEKKNQIITNYACVTIMTIQNGQCIIIVFWKNQFIRYSKIVPHVTIKKMLKLMTQIITHSEENKYVKSLKIYHVSTLNLMN